MTEPQRLLTGGDELESALLTSAECDGPSEQAVKTTLVALGLGAGLAAGATTASASTATSLTTTGSGAAASGAAASMAPATAATTAVGKAGLGVVGKWLGIAAIGGLALWGASQLTGTDETQPPDPVAIVPAVAPAAADKSAADAEDTTEPAAADNRDDHGEPAGEKGEQADEQAEASPAPQSGSLPMTQAKTKPKVADASQLGDEVAALDSARKAMADDPDKALEAIEKYQERFEGGVLGQEAEVLRIEALAKAGKLDRAKALGQAFLAKHPSSPLAKRVRSVLSTAASD